MGFDTPGEPNYMNAAGLRLANAGYVVIAPHIVCSPPGFGKDRIRLDRLARLIGKGLLGFEIFELRRVLDYLGTRQDVLPGHIGILGISQGGKNALFLAALDTRIAAVVVSGFFNNRWNKMLEEEYLLQASRQERLSYVPYLATEEDDKFNPFSAPLFPDHLLGALICPRPLMVQIGGKDPVVYWRDAVKEFELVRKVYSRLGIAERAHASVVRLGGHEIFFDEAKEFLDKWLRAKKND
jgi:dienelactone hydrolase